MGVSTHNRPKKHIKQPYQNLPKLSLGPGTTCISAGCLIRPTSDGNTALGTSSWAKPTRHMLLPTSSTKAPATSMAITKHGHRICATELKCQMVGEPLGNHWFELIPWEAKLRDRLLILDLTILRRPCEPKGQQVLG